jgi:metal-responsive CopG/Arc/MetJ family transcriptional regulator
MNSDMSDTEERDITTATVPRQLLRDFNKLPDYIRKRYSNFSDFVRAAVRSYLEEKEALAYRDIRESTDTSRDEPP